MGTMQRSQSIRLSHEAVPVGIDLGRTKNMSADRNPMVKSLVDAVDTLEALEAKHAIPPVMVATCKGLLFLRVDKVGLAFSLTQGYGILLRRMPDTEQGWSAPLPVKVEGVSFGAVLGYSKQNSVVCLANDSDIEQFFQNKRKVKFGVDVGVEAGKLNGQASVNNQGNIKNEVMGYSTKTYTISKGLFVDVSLAGTSIETDVDDLASVYGETTTAADVLSGRVSAPREAAIIYHAVKQVEAKFDGELRRQGSGPLASSPRGRVSKDPLPSVMEGKGNGNSHV